MIQCRDCEYFVRGPAGEVGFRCDPFATIKEPECLVKWQLLKLEMMVRSYQATIEIYRRLAPLQEKMFRHMQREIDEAEQADSWKYEDADDEDVPPEEDPPRSGR